MARQFSFPVATRAAGTYGPLEVNGRQVGDRGVHIEVVRGADGVWPLTASDPILTVLIEYLYAGVWFAAAEVTFTGGTQEDRWSGGTRLSDWVTVEWPMQNVGGVLSPLKPDAARASFIVHTAADIGGSVQWLA